MDRTTKALKCSSLFCTLTKADTDLVLSSSSFCSFSVGEVLLSDKKHICLIVSGKAAVYKGKSFLKFLEPGELFGVATLFSDEKEVSKVVAKTKTEALFISEATVANLISSSPDFAMKYISFLSGRIRYLNKKIDYYISSDTASTLLKYLHDLPCDSDGMCSLGLNMQNLARSLNIGRASLYRAFDKLEAEGIIKKEKNKIKIL